jgi:hypothetical protein
LGCADFMNNGKEETPGEVVADNLEPFIRKYCLEPEKVLKLLPRQFRKINALRRLTAAEPEG